ncbi:hypothetical protein fHeYen801_132 [Yersinia phage fHe-Yen8-01]|nr:hypothetical protein fHeYen801_132 [Yersinia phage fHe-Yen8-01]
MWLILSDGFLSAVVDRNDENKIMVRARRAEHLTAYFPKKEIETYAFRDYQFRVIVNRDELKEMLCQYVTEMMYDNFKNSVKERKYHDACFSVWGIMEALQPMKAYSNYTGEPDCMSVLDDSLPYGTHQYSGKHKSATFAKTKGKAKVSTLNQAEVDKKARGKKAND